jgi:hypothetical protein
MKLITKHLVQFSLLFLLGTIVFRFGLSRLLDNGQFTLVWVLAALYFFYNFYIGWVNGKNDYQSLPLYDIGFRFHLATYAIFVIVSWLWFQTGLASVNEKIETLFITAAIWGFFIIIHSVFFFVSRKDAINGINREDVFE